MPAYTKRENPSAASNRLRAVVVLSLPAIVGTAFFLTGVIVSEIVGPGVAPADPFGEPTGVAGLKLALGSASFWRVISARPMDHFCCHWPGGRPWR